ncbi:hypothetical protein GGR57DRAFT_442175 [Xylariaceae sp. FL1272]|nr:hypothetical protein GGR57DRAFT_442175 [Xylariaceae sp. FL1272]
MSATTASQLPILIVGAGPAGLTLAQSLRRLDIPFRLFERDSKTLSRPQGYRIRLVDGAKSLKAVVPEDVAALFDASCGDAMKGLKKLDAMTGGEVAGRPWGPPGGPPGPAGAGPRRPMMGPDPKTVDRGVLRKVLLSGIEDMVEFGKTFDRYEIDEEHECVTAFFDDGTTAKGRFLVGAEGRSSRVRRQYVPDIVRVDTEGCLLFGMSPITPELSEIMDKAGVVGMCLLEDEKTLPTKAVVLMERILWSPEIRDNMANNFANSGVKLPQDYVYWVYATRRSSMPPPFNSLNGGNQQAAVDAIVSLTKDFSPELRAVFAAQDPSQTNVFHLISTHPDIKPWSPSKYVTVVGDAITVMPPTAASGANTALINAQQLSGMIEEHRDKITVEAVAQYEEDLRTIAKEKINSSLGAGVGTFGQKPLEECEVIKSQ